MSRIWLGREGTEQLLSSMGRRLSEEDIEISKQDRTASGKLVIDLVAIKKQFKLEYSFVNNAVLEQLRQIYELGGTLNLKIEREDLSIDEYYVRCKPFSRSRFLLGGKWYWEGISIELEEI